MDTEYQSDARMNIAFNQVNYASLHCILLKIIKISAHVFAQMMNENEPFHEKGTLKHVKCVK